MKYEKGLNDSYLHNCLIIRRAGDPAGVLFRRDKNGFTASLNGYAIVPIEEYTRLVELASPSNETLKEIEEADKELHGKSKDLAS